MRRRASPLETSQYNFPIVNDCVDLLLSLNYWCFILTIHFNQHQQREKQKKIWIAFRHTANFFVGRSAFDELKSSKIESSKTDLVCLCVVDGSSLLITISRRQTATREMHYLQFAPIFSPFPIQYFRFFFAGIFFFWDIEGKQTRFVWLNETVIFFISASLNVWQIFGHFVELTFSSVIKKTQQKKKMKIVLSVDHAQKKRVEQKTHCNRWWVAEDWFCRR